MYTVKLREVIQSTNPGHCSCPYFTQSRKSHARIIWKTLRTLCILNIYSYTYLHLSGYKENVCTNLQHHPEFQVEVGKLISVLHSKPIEATWEWHATGWTLWFVYCLLLKRTSWLHLCQLQHTTQSDSWLPTASPAKEVEGWTCQVWCSCFDGWWYNHLGKCAEKGTQHSSRASINIFHLQEGRRATYSQEFDGHVRVSEISKIHSMSKSANMSIQGTAAKQQHEISNTTYMTKKGDPLNAATRITLKAKRQPHVNKNTTSTGMI